MHNEDKFHPTSHLTSTNLLLTADFRPAERDPQAFASGDIGNHVRVSSACGIRRETGTSRKEWERPTMIIIIKKKPFIAPMLEHPALK